MRESHIAIGYALAEAGHAVQDTCASTGDGGITYTQPRLRPDCEKATADVRWIRFKDTPAPTFSTVSRSCTGEGVRAEGIQHPDELPSFCLTRGLARTRVSLAARGVSALQRCGGHFALHFTPWARREARRLPANNPPTHLTKTAAGPGEWHDRQQPGIKLRAALDDPYLNM
eukprot:364913-Chlamydomonas_euryale.AAC.3